MPAATASVLGDLFARANHADGYDPWMRQVEGAGYCAHPVRLAGSVEEADRATGEVRTIFTTATQPDRVLLKACGNRRASRCPSCSETYRGDAWQHVAAGLRGGKGIPETVASHPRLFVTFTAPGFGAVHTIRERHGRPRPCRPRNPRARCPHGRWAGCWRRHTDDDPDLGRPLCGDCFDYEAAVLWNALAPELWRRTTIYLRRALARRAGLTPAALNRLVRVAFVKVAEYQRRGVVHFHAIIRLDATPPRDQPDRLDPPPATFTPELLAEAVRDAATTVAVARPAVAGAPERVARWGAQLDVRILTANPGGELSAEAVAGYVAKYATKGTEGLGAALDRRLDEADLDHLDTDEHVAGLVRACWQLGGDPALTRFKLRRWAHQLGYGGHWSTKSRRYSTTFTALRRARRDHAVRRKLAGAVPLDAWGRPADQEATVVLATWTYTGSGHRTPGDAWLAASAAARARERRRIAREELAASA